MGDNNPEEEEQIEVPITKKDPRRVEQGKRLAAISREAKERKMRRKIMEEMESEKSKFNYKWWAIGGISFLTIMYLFYKSGKKDDYEDLEMVVIPEKKKKSPKKNKSPEKKNSTNFEEFD